MQAGESSPRMKFLGTHYLEFKATRRMKQMGLRKNGQLGKKEFGRVKHPRSQKKKVTKEMVKGMYLFRNNISFIHSQIAWHFNIVTIFKCI